jgi:hypothetical protein
MASGLDVPTRLLLIVSEATSQGDVDFENFQVMYARNFVDHEAAILALTLSPDLPELHAALRVIAITEEGVILSSAPLGVKIR